MGIEQTPQQTALGTFPADWKVKQIVELSPYVTSGSRGWAEFYSEYGDLFVRITNLSRASIFLDLEDVRFVKVPRENAEAIRTQLQNGDVLVSITADIGIIGYVTKDVPKPAFINQHIALVRFNRSLTNSQYVSYFLAFERSQKYFRALTDAGAKAGLNLTTVRQIRLALPPSKTEQDAIANALNDADDLIESLRQLLAKKHQVKQGAMQELLTGKKRLPGFDKAGEKKQKCELGLIPADWKVAALETVINCLDNVRVPLNEAQRAALRGDIPYCGANGVLDYINDYIIDDDIILMAEDGGYFDEYQTRPIAYRMSGKCWVNNHAHILKAKSGTDQDFIYYSLVNKNILRFLASGTRAKLNRSELNRIEIPLPTILKEQAAIASILVDMDTEIDTLEAKLTKARQIKQGMTHELLTGRIRLV